MLSILDLWVNFFDKFCKTHGHLFKYFVFSFSLPFMQLQLHMSDDLIMFYSSENLPSVFSFFFSLCFILSQINSDLFSSSLILSSLCLICSSSHYISVIYDIFQFWIFHLVLSKFPLFCLFVFLLNFFLLLFPIYSYTLSTFSIRSFRIFIIVLLKSLSANSNVWVFCGLIFLGGVTCSCLFTSLSAF